MTQQINLLTQAFRKQRRSLASAAVLAPVIALIGVLGVAAWGHVRTQVTTLRAELAGVEHAVKTEQETQLKLAQEFGARTKDPALAAEVERLDRQLRMRRASLDVLKSGVIGNTEGFSRHMLGFARRSIEGLWLTGFSIAGAGSEISVEGRALRAELVPAYIRGLAQEPAFSGRDFAALTIERPKPQTNKEAPEAGEYLAFRLASAAESGLTKGVAGVAGFAGTAEIELTAVHSR